MKKVLVIGSGGREHALVWRLARDRERPELFCAPGNAGTAEAAVNLDIAAGNVPALLDWARANRPDLTVVGPEAPLCAGLADVFQDAGLRVFGPSRAAARLEGSKSFAGEVMAAAGVPKAAFRIFEQAGPARAHIRERGAPVVVKADGLAAGKGVFVCRIAAEAEQALEQIMGQRAFGAAGDRVVVEECLEGEEASILALVDGERVVMLASSQDHKRAYNNDSGPNTGGMGAYSPAPVVTEELWPVIRSEVFERMLAELRRRNIVYRGVLYAGLMLTASGPRVLEFNCRFGDPETQAILPRLASDLVPALEACADGGLEEGLVRWRPEACACVVMASGGYPGDYRKNKVVDGLDKVAEMEGVMVFHAGTRREDGKVVTSGGRVLGVTAVAPDLRGAVRRAYRAITQIRFDQAQYRTDIGARALRHDRAP